MIFQINRVKKEANVGKGITFDAFKCFYNVLFGGADLERAMFFLDTEKNGINRLIQKKLRMNIYLMNNSVGDVYSK